MLKPAITHQLENSQSHPCQACQPKRYPHAPNDNVVEGKCDRSICPLLDPGQVCSSTQQPLLFKNVLQPARVKRPIPKAWSAEGNGLDDAKGECCEEEDGEQAYGHMLKGRTPIACPASLIKVDHGRHQDGNRQCDHVEFGGEPEPEEEAGQGMIPPAATIVRP